MTEAATRLDVMMTHTFHTSMLFTTLSDGEPPTTDLQQTLEHLIGNHLLIINEDGIVGLKVETMVLHIDIPYLDYAKFFFFYAKELRCMEEAASITVTELGDGWKQLPGRPIHIRMDFTSRIAGAAKDHLAEKFQQCPVQFFYDDMADSKQQ